MRMSRMVAVVVLMMVFESTLKAEKADDFRPILKIKDNVATVSQQEKVLFSLSLNPPERIKASSTTGREYEERRDSAYLVGHCLLVQRGTVPGELYYTVGKGEVYDIYTHKMTEYPGSSAMYWGGQAFSPPSVKWAVMLQEEEGMLSGYYFLGQGCSITSHKFEEHLFNNSCGTDQDKSPSFGSDESLTLSFQENEGTKCFKVVIRPEGNHEIEEILSK